MAKKKPLVIFKGDTTITHLGEKQKRREPSERPSAAALSPKSAISQQCSHGTAVAVRAESKRKKSKL